MAHHGYAPVSYWLGLTLPDLREWMKVHNKLIEEREKKLGGDLSGES